MTRLIAQLVLIALAAGSISVRAGIYPDDHGNLPTEATPLSGPSNSVSGLIEFDTDVDYFSIPFYPAMSYIIQIRTNTIRDLDLEITPPGWSTPYLETNTVWSSPAAVSWTNSGALGYWRLRVGGMFAYTTGSYHLAVWQSPSNQDLDGDSMADAWEVSELGSTTNKPGDDYDYDGQTNLEEFLAQTQADDFNSFVGVDWMTRTPGEDRFGWYQAAFSTYEILTSTNVTGPWEYLENNVRGDTSGFVTWTNGAPDTPTRFYRVDFIY